MKTIKKWIVPGLLPASILILWELCVKIFSIPLYLLPSPSQTIMALFSNLQVIFPHMLLSLWEAFLGLVIAGLLAIMLGVPMDIWPSFRKAVYPLMVVSQSIPTIVLAPLFMIYFGFGIAPKVITVVLMCFFPIAVSLVDGFSQVSPKIIDLLRTMGANKVDVYRIAKLPGAAPYFFSGLRVAATYSIMGAVVGEWLGGSGGLGFYMIRVKNAYMLDKVFAVVLLVIILSLAMNGCVRLLEYILTPWMRKENKVELQ
ncbi:MAG TPA: ABC transporter permease [Clostridia bacterium]|nr:ABC transporter permease [Clostridia bacterium]